MAKKTLNTHLIFFYLLLEQIHIFIVSWEGRNQKTLCPQLFFFLLHLEQISTFVVFKYVRRRKKPWSTSLKFVDFKGKGIILPCKKLKKILKYPQIIY